MMREDYTPVRGKVTVKQVAIKGNRKQSTKKPPTELGKSGCRVFVAVQQRKT